MRFRFFDHTADIRIRSYGETLDEMFINSVYAIKSLMLGRQKTAQGTLRTITVSGYDINRLFYNFIEQLIFLFDTGFLVPDRVLILKVIQDEEYHLESEIYFDRSDNFIIETGIKAITYSEMCLGKTPTRRYLQFVLDI